MQNHETNPRQIETMGRLIKFLIYLAILGFAALVAYTYVAPFFGVDFAPAQEEIRKPVTLDAT